MLARLLLAATLAFGTLGAAHAQRTVTFDHGGASVVLPATYVTSEQNDGTLRALFGPAADHRLEIGIRDVEGPEGVADPGVQFVRIEAQAQKLRTFEQQGRVVFMQPAPDVEEAGKKMRVAVWYVGFGNSVAAVRLVAPQAPTLDLQLFFAKGLDDVVASVRRTRPAKPPG
ncbi:MAG: hypothetical protein U1F10_07750 [Burkholderiales bacterium]